MRNTRPARKATFVVTGNGQVTLCSDTPRDYGAHPSSSTVCEAVTSSSSQRAQAVESVRGAETREVLLSIN